MPPRRDLGHARSLGGHRRRVRHLGLCAVQCEAQKGPNLGSTSSAKSRDRSLILLVHRQDIVEPLAVVRSDPASPLSACVETPQTCAPLCPLVRRVSDVPGAGPGRVHEDLMLQPLASWDVLEDALRKRGTTIYYPCRRTMRVP